MNNIYSELQERLDDMSVGYPKTESGIEIKILKRLFTEQEAELFLQLSPKLESPEQISTRLKKDIGNMAKQLEQMAKKGLIFRKRKGDIVRYGSIPFIVGILEFQLNNMDREFARDMEQYYKQGLGKAIKESKTRLMRTVPVNKELVVKWPIAPYEDVLEIIDSQEKIAVANCICRTWGRQVDNGCDKPLEACFSFGSHSDYYVENNMGRYVDKEEAKDIIKKNLEQAPLVMQPINSQKIGGMCMCCGDCCGMLRALKQHPNPAQAVQSNYYAQIDTEKCESCELCMERCQMDAISLPDTVVEIDLNRCIGCGICVPTCPAEAIKLIKKPEQELYTPHNSMIDTYAAISLERGKLEKMVEILAKTES